MAQPEVILSDTITDLSKAVYDCFNHFGGANSLLKSSKDVYIKVNLIDCKKYCYTDITVVNEVIMYLKNNGAKNIYVMENCIQGNFTRLVFKATGLTDVCSKTGAIPVYLDEKESMPVYLETLQSFIDISKFVYENLIKNKNDNLYISIPKLKTHSMTSITLGIKNQFGLVQQISRIPDHNFKLHQKLADIYKLIRPDFTIIDGLIATNNGHYIAEKNSAKSIVPMNLLIAGNDALATDVVGAALIGFNINDVDHLKLASLTGIGTGDINQIKIINDNLFKERKQNLTCELLDDFPPDLIIIRGQERACKEGCKRNTETVVEVLHRDHGGKGGFTIIMGKGIPKSETEKITGRVHIAGNCAISEHSTYLINKLGSRNVTLSYGCNSLAETVYGLCKQMKVNPLSLVPINPVLSVYELALAKINNTKAIISKFM